MFQNIPRRLGAVIARGALRLSNECVFIVFAALTLGCSARDLSESEYTPWVEADALFLGDDRFLGADSAYSVDLGQGRVLWLLGDTFVAEPLGARSTSALVRNSLAVQSGYDPSIARIEFFFGERDGLPFPFVGAEEPTWLWPGPASMVNDSLLITYSELERVSDGLGFSAVGSFAYLVDNPGENPRDWNFVPLDLPEPPPGSKWGTGALLLDQERLYAFVVVEPGDHDVFLARWNVNDVAQGDLLGVEWYDPQQGWGASPKSVSPIVRDLQTEFSVHRDPVSGQFWLTSVDGFGATNIVRRIAIRPEGPWSKSQWLARPEESQRGGLIVYSAKSHPHLGGGRDVITYCSNSLDFSVLLEDESIYYPRFFRPQVGMP